MEIAIAKYEKLKEYIAALGSLAVAFSGGVDSTFLLYAAREAIGDKVIAVTAALYSFPQRELDESKRYCESLGVKHLVVRVNELEIEGFAENPVNRCYICKLNLMKQVIKAANDNKIMNVAEGSNLDDEGDYRPGLIAVGELGIKSPLREIGFTKQEIRDLSKHLNIPTWNKPSFACLSSRFPYGDLITKEKLKMVEMAEQLFFDMGYSQFRVRIHGNLARIELLENDMYKFMQADTRTKVYEKLKEIGFEYVSLDIAGYRTGRMNEDHNLRLLNGTI